MGLCQPTRSGKGLVLHTPAPVSTMMFFDCFRRCTASSIVLYRGSLTRFESSRVIPRPRSGKYLKSGWPSKNGGGLIPKAVHNFLAVIAPASMVSVMNWSSPTSRRRFRKMKDSSTVHTLTGSISHQKLIFSHSKTDVPSSHSA